ncbi:RNA polymerase sigma factor [Maribacter sp. 2210JD10-5]|uniref:RNA polymerase sigma factor n=1 Tax=Maribacter sp. 2210JD10-5 TaxID=3386272 RepID=UPI0039BD5DD9
MELDYDNNILLKSALKNGDEKAFRVFYDKYFDSLSNYLNSLTNDKAATKDILQEAFITFWNKRDELLLDRSFQSYLFKIAHNIFINQYRKNTRKLKLLDEIAYSVKIATLENDQDLVERKITFLRETISQLPTRCRQIFEMGKYQGYTYKEIAEKLNISVKTVEVQMGKAFSILRDKISSNPNLFNFICFYKLFVKKMKVSTNANSLEK